MGTDVAPRRRRLRIELAAGIGVLTLLLAVIIVPPLVNIGRYKARIAEAISASLGRPVRLSSVELRLFPRPGFVLTDLTVDEDPAYGAEPLLHANTVMASIRFASLWRGLEISRISVDEASLNLVRTKIGSDEGPERGVPDHSVPGLGLRRRQQVPSADDIPHPVARYKELAVAARDIFRAHDVVARDLAHARECCG